MAAEEVPEGMLRAYECLSEDSQEVVGISIWDSYESREQVSARRSGGRPT